MKMLSKKRILILGQGKDVADGFKTILEKGGYEVIANLQCVPFDDVEISKKPDVIILNMDIPKKLGLAFLRKTRTVFPALPIIAMSAYAFPSGRNEMRRFGVDDFVAKPFEIEQLKKKIEQLIIRNNLV